jgi:hypothetical protein
MKYFAEINNDNKVLRVIEVEDINCLDSDGNHSELIGSQYCDSQYYDAVWKQTYVNGHIRKRFAYSGCEYSEGLDAFIPPKPQSKWILDETTCDWIAPVEAPGINYFWNDKEGEWEEKENIILPE